MKIAICLPVHGDTRALFTHSLAKMLLTTVRDWSVLGRTDQPEIEPILASSATIAGNRERLVREAETWGAEWILWLDSDQTFPPTTLLRLLSLNQPVVGANYPRRDDQARPTATIVQDGVKLPVWSTPDKVAGFVLEPVTYMGLGVCLMSLAALRKIEKPYFAGDKEDVYVFEKLAAAGTTPLIDHHLSAEVGHIRIQVLTNEHSLAEQPRVVKLMGGTAACPSSS